MEKARTRVLHITSLYPSSARPAFGIFVKTQIDSLRPYVDVSLFVIQGLSGFWPYITSIPSLLRVLYFEPFDVIHVHYGNVASMVKLLYYGESPIVTSYCGDDLLGTAIGDGKFTLKSRLFRRINKWLATRDSCSIIKSNALGERIPSARRRELVPNGVDISHFKPTEKELAKRQLELNAEKKIILFPANPEIPLKNFGLIKEALSQLNPDEYQILTFEGNKVHPDRVPQYFNASDLVVFTSFSEGSPNVIKEAMACGCTIYSVNCGDVAWLLDGVTDSKILPYDSAVWANELRSFLSGPPMGPSNSRSVLIQKSLDVDSIARRIVKIYDSLIRKN
jgi:teichuronic acid biosynthesis glycosyltransferase TuaC